MAYDIQDWFFENGLVSDKQIFDMKYEDEMWSGLHFEQAKFMLFRRGVISFDNDVWHRRIRIDYLSRSEREYYFPVLANSGAVSGRRMAALIPIRTRTTIS